MGLVPQVSMVEQMGPYSTDDAPEDGTRIDMGALRIPTISDMELHADYAPGTLEITQVRLVIGNSVVAIQVFAAPRGEEMWPGVRTEISKALESANIDFSVSLNRWGTQIQAMMPSVTSDKTKVLRPTRFLGIDGDRWFLRIVIAGDGAHEEVASSVIDAVLSDLVVHRGVEPRTPGARLELNLPVT